MRLSVIGLFLFLIGCSEASFELSPDSRLPKWFSDIEINSRDNYMVKMTYYVNLGNRSADIVLYTIEGKKIKKIKGKMLNEGPLRTNKSYPMYEAIEANGLIELIKHTKMEPIFYVSDEKNKLNEILED